MAIMKSVILSSLLLVISTNAFADIQTSDTRYSNWVSGERRGYLLEETANNKFKQKDFYINGKSGGIFIPRSLNGARKMKDKELMQTGNKSESRRYFHSAL